jgi:dipeptidyl aminopeptidase/acylaminoacyl peptidase
MPFARTVALLVVLCQPFIAAAQGLPADFERSALLAARTAGLVRGDVDHLQWLDDATCVFTRQGEKDAAPEFLLVDARTGLISPLFDRASLVGVLGDRAMVRRVVADGAALMLLVETPEPVVVRSADRGLTWTRVSLEEAAPMHAGQGRADGGGETRLVIVNRTQRPLSLFWLNGEERVPYGKVAADATRTQHTFAGHRWMVVDADGAIVREFMGEAEPSIVLVPPPPAVDAPVPPETVAMAPSAAAKPAPAAKVDIVDRNVRIIDVSGREVFRTSDGTKEAGYDGAVHTSPDGRWALVMWNLPEGERRVHMVQSSPGEGEQPRLKTIDYLKPGDRIAVDMPRLVDVEGRRVVTLAADLFPTPWSIGHVHWSTDGKTVSFTYNERGHEVVRLVAVDVPSCTARVVAEERHGAFIDYVNSVRVDHLDATGEALWMSERDGWRHLYLLDMATGEVKSQVTKGEWVVRSIERVDETARQVWFWAGGIRPEQDPYHLHLARVNFDGSGLVVLTEGDGTHRVTFSPGGDFFVDRSSRVDMPGVTELRRSSDGSLVATLAVADWSALRALPWTPPERFVAKGRDGRTDIHGIIMRPSNFDPSRRYPVLEQIYAGPHSAHVPKAFSAHLGAHEMAELGFIVVQIDGMGTAHRSRAFHEVAWRNLIDAGLPDRVAWIKAAAATRPEMDLTRVGIYGGSAGGQNALAAMLTHGDFYKAAAADCGCHDNRMDKIWWNELWMGWPVGPHYAANSNVTHAAKLRGRLLLIVGELDSNVDPASTMQVVDALVKANKRFDLLVMPGVGHGAAGHPYAKRRQQEFFLEAFYGWRPDEGS